MTRGIDIVGKIGEQRAEGVFVAWKCGRLAVSHDESHVTVSGAAAIGSRYGEGVGSYIIEVTEIFTCDIAEKDRRRRRWRRGIARRRSGRGDESPKASVYADVF